MPNPNRCVIVTNDDLHSLAPAASLTYLENTQCNCHVYNLLPVLVRCILATAYSLGERFFWVHAVAVGSQYCDAHSFVEKIVLSLLYNMGSFPGFALLSRSLSISPVFSLSQRSLWHKSSSIGRPFW